MSELVLILLLAVAAMAFMNWRLGLVLCVVTAILQDPLRKLTPGQPVYFVVLVGVVFGAAWLGALVNRVKLAPNGIDGWRQNIGTPFTLFVILAIFQALHSLAVYQNPTMTAIGVLSYFAPVPAVVFAYQFAMREGMAGIRRWMKFYLAIAMIALCSVILESSGASWRILGEVGEGVFISGQGEYYKGNSGIFRAAEIAAWHGATVACFAFIVFSGRRFSLPKLILVMALVVFLLYIGALTGRRKMIIEITIFICAYFSLGIWFNSHKGKLAVLVALLGVVSYIGIVGWVARGPGELVERSSQLEDAEGTGFGRYSARAGTVFEDLPIRLRTMGVRPIEWAIDSQGWLGGGLGIGSQGAQHFGAEGNGAAESGLGKLTVELGMPGLVLAFWLVLAMARHIWKLLGTLSHLSRAHANFAYGLVAFLIANAATFSIATQAYADIFILLSLGLSLGFLFAQLKLASRQVKN
ncbi:MAG: hypothetical protein ACREO2_06705, partial [Arenimonas sp.]